MGLHSWLALAGKTCEYGTAADARSAYKVPCLLRLLPSSNNPRLPCQLRLCAFFSVGNADLHPVEFLGLRFVRITMKLIFLVWPTQEPRKHTTHVRCSQGPPTQCPCGRSDRCAPRADDCARPRSPKLAHRPRQPKTPWRPRRRPLVPSEARQAHSACR